MNKPLTLGAVAVLLMAGGQANAQVACHDISLSDIGPTFRCTDGNLTFENFSFTGGDLSFTTAVFMPDSVRFTSSVPNQNAGTLMWDYTVTTSAGAINGGTLAQSTSTIVIPGFPAPVRSTSTTMDGIVLVVQGNTSASGSISPPAATLMVANHSIPTGTGVVFLDSLTNSFSSVPEPMSLSLFGLGLAGLALFARRRRS